jgi:hypothetical protein
MFACHEEEQHEDEEASVTLTSSLSYREDGVGGRGVRESLRLLPSRKVGAGYQKKRKKKDRKLKTGVCHPFQSALIIYIHIEDGSTPPAGRHP